MAALWSVSNSRPRARWDYSEPAPAGSCATNGSKLRISLEVSLDAQTGYRHRMADPSAVGAGPSAAPATTAGHRGTARQRVVEAAADLLAREGRDAVTTRA